MKLAHLERQMKLEKVHHQNFLLSFSGHLFATMKDEKIPKSKNKAFTTKHQQDFTTVLQSLMYNLSIGRET